MSRHAQSRYGDLQRELRELVCLAVLGDHVRWVLTEDDGSLAAWLAKAVPQWRALADEVAKHLVRLDVPPDARVRALAGDASLNWVRDGWLRRDEAEELVAGRVRVLASWARLRRSQATDPDVAQLFETVSTALERLSCPRRTAPASTSP